MRFSSFRRLAAAGAAAVLLGLAGPAGAEEAAPRITGVVELFTSQGCNSCPRADAVLKDLGGRPDLVTLGYHVDYWDYLGWRDTLGTAENTERQRLYMRALKSRSVYTPQAVVNGRVHLNGANHDGLLRALKEMSLAGAGLAVPLRVTEAADSILIEAGPVEAEAGGRIRKAHLLLVSFDPPRPVQIRTGENGGRTITYWNPVIGIQSAGLWHGEPMRYELPASAVAPGKGSVALLQAVDAEGLPGPILGAAVIRRPGE